MVWKETMMHEVVRFRQLDDGKIIMLKEEKFNSTFNSRFLERKFWLYFNDPRQIFIYLYQHFNLKFPRHFIFANFQCLRCGELCNNQREVQREDIERWMNKLRYDILEYVDCWLKNGRCFHLSDLLQPCEECWGGIIITLSSSGRCPFLRKVKNKPYYKCRIHDTSPETCRGYLCEKSLPIAHVNWDNIEELIEKIGTERLGRLWKRKRG